MMSQPQKRIDKCDIAINIYGKYYQTLVSLKTLIQHNKEHIGKIFLIMEKRQPEPFNIEKFLEELQYDDVEVYIPKHYFGFKRHVSLKLTKRGLKIKIYKGFTKKYNYRKVTKDTDYRRSIRYQYAFEASDKECLFIMHNDVLFTASFIPEMMKHIEQGYLGVGSIGQCWNCPLHFAHVCDSDVAQSLKLTYLQVAQIVKDTNSPRTAVHHIDREHPLPMPECRLNEWVAMINRHTYCDITQPAGTITPFGKMGFDIGTDFYREAVLQGHSFKNIDIKRFSVHGPFSQGCGNAALFNPSQFLCEEEAAREFLRSMS